MDETRRVSITESASPQAKSKPRTRLLYRRDRAGVQKRAGADAAPGPLGAIPAPFSHSHTSDPLIDAPTATRPALEGTFWRAGEFRDFGSRHLGDQGDQR
jgi:hypothetical protein